MVGDQVVVWKGNGLGGGSLVNSNVSIMPEKRIFSTGTWPTEIRCGATKFFIKINLKFRLNLKPCSFDFR